MNPSAIPTDPDRREAWSRDPDAYQVSERLYDAADELGDAVYEQVNASGLLFDVMHAPMRAALAEKGRPMPTMDRLVEARQRVERAEAEWAAAASAADALLRRRQEGGA
jgi:hypothetical protein